MNVSFIRVLCCCTAAKRGTKAQTETVSFLLLRQGFLDAEGGLVSLKLVQPGHRTPLHVTEAYQRCCPQLT